MLHRPSNFTRLLRMRVNIFSNLYTFIILQIFKAFVNAGMQTCHNILTSGKTQKPHSYPLSTSFKQIRTQAACALHGLVVAPFGYLGLMAAEQYIGHSPAIILSRTCIHRRSQQIILE